MHRVLTDAPGPVGSGLVALGALDDLTLAGVRTHRVDALEAGAAGLRQGAALVDV